MPAVNQLLVDEAVRHQLDLAHYSNSVIRQIITILNKTDADLYGELAKLLERYQPSAFRMSRLESLLGSLRAMGLAAYGQIGTALTAELKDFMAYEAAYRSQVLVSALPVQVHVATVSASQLFAAAMAQPFQGVLLPGALKDVSARRQKLIQRTIAQGYVEGRTNDQIIRSIRGTRANGFADGLLETSRRETATIVQTAVAHTAGFAADAAAAANADIVKSVMWSSTLDLKTTPGCRLRDGLTYDPVTHEPQGHSIPWLGGPGRLHYNCRSGQIELLKSMAELGIDLPELIVAGTRASMDGQVPKTTPYFDWLARQSATRQDEVLGPIRGALFRSGKLPLDRMYGLDGHYLTLEELRARDSAAFARAGL
jgi:hypothetical protein